ncbi:MAG: Homoserine dehydrogenase [Candidatus Aramenus sulfurataquae]|uniref:Homoserine dehydrogenase n=2 Tax=Candidatus Aramenus sulfurataquae TaxID=1326980 RepID=W7L8K5_9CREN|nr:MAG: Homoserine dehydrogenase [Candidatus Aramenus sulfurataquae]MCL7343063.1 homoserine dehydrogenase [Candidatus Aramenus sulfurataquae]
MRLMLVGYGNVGKAFRKLLHEKKVNATISAIVTSRGVMFRDAEEFATEKRLTALEALEEVKPDVVVDMSVANYRDGEPSLSLYLRALSQGIHVITTNKSPLALKFQEIMDTAKRHNAKVGFQATVMSGTPSINLARVMPYVQTIRLRGILNGTTNYILTKMYEGLSYEEALKEAQAKGYAEANPELDVNGFDAAAKLAILANVYLKSRVTINDVKFTGIKGVTKEDIERAKRENSKVKLVAYADRNVIKVSPEMIRQGDELYNVDGVNNALQVETDVQKVTIIGPGAGPLNAAYGALSDLSLIINGAELL